MSKVDLNFIPDIIDSYIGGLERDHAQGIETQDSYTAKVEVLEQLKRTFKSFIKDSNANIKV